jgi:hypothetical protein
MFGVRLGVVVGNTSISGGGSGFDTDAQAYFDRVTTASGTLTTTEKNAVNQLVLDMKSYGIWTSMKAIYPMVGASAAACAQNLKSSSFTGAFSSGWTFASTGVTPNGTSAYFNTGFNPSANGSLNNQHYSVYSRTNISNTACDIGGYIAPVESSMYLRYGGTNIVYSCVNSSLSSQTTNNANSAAFFMVLRNNATGENTFINSTKYTRTITSISLINLNIYIGALNNNGTPVAFSTRQNAFSSIGDGLTDTQASNFYTAVQAFQTTLSRNV